MGLGDNNLATVPTEKNPHCDSCKAPITSRILLHTTVCGHSFHKECIAKCLKLRPYCPECNVRIVNDGSQKNTRSQTKTPTQTPDLRNTSLNISMGNATGDTSMLTQSVVETSAASAGSNESLKDMISSIVTAQQFQLLTALSAQISKLVETNVQACFSRLNNSNEANASTSQVNNQGLNRQESQASGIANPAAVQHTPPHRMQDVSAVETRAFRELLGLDSGDSRSRSA